MEAEHPLILIVDDDKFLAGIVEQKLVLEKFQVERADTADEATRLLQQGKRPDLVLLDIQLPGKSGLDMLEELRGKPEFYKLPVIVLSNFNQPEDVERGKKLGVLRHIQKVTLTPSEVVDVVRSALAGKA
jgi:two-component system OmpR family response regulator